jgi:hypothetical protein
MTVWLETVIKDSTTCRSPGIDKPYERFDAAEGDVFLDGPVCRRVAVLDFDPSTGALSPPVPFLPPSPRRKISSYSIADPEDVHSVDIDESQRLRDRPQDDEDVRGRKHARPTLDLGLGRPAAPRGSPGGEVGQRVLRARFSQPPVLRSPLASVCTSAGAYGDTEETAVRNRKTLVELGRRCKISSVEGLFPGGHLDLIFPARRPGKAVIRTRAN